MDTGNISKEYSNGEVTIVWQPKLCFHSERCIHGLPSVFDRNGKPWINPNGATTEQIVQQVSRCPSGALSTYMNAEGPTEKTQKAELIIELSENGPLLVEGPFTIRDSSGKETHVEGSAALCRCGGSQNKPFCDGTHNKIGFKS